MIQLDRKTIAKRKRAAKAIQKLTPAERAVFNLLIQGMSAKQMGEKLKRSPFTISNHRFFE